MATNKVNIDLTLQDSSASIKKRTSEVEALNKQLTKSQQMATGTKTGASAVKSTYNAASENTAYGQARGSMGATGASARDFANQAQGLGGLVRLYATYAANVFALTAAFNALRDAMSTDMMISGLNQLGAASGVSMGSLAKDFAKASGGAISLRESMEATAKAVSSGLSGAQFMELGKVAKGASQALGVNMSDAVSRLTRGITKLEPELLDELGIFTKVEKAAEDYARSVGKSVTSLTDFERRQAFANAVLAEGQQKFGQIAAQTNPYDQLLASLKNTAQSILSTVNTVIAPIAQLLADNTGLITAAFALMGVKIVQQALPALLSWQKGLKDAAAVSAGKLSELVNPEGFVERAQARFNVPKLEAELAKAEAAYAATAKKFVDTDNNYKTKSSSLLKTMAAGGLIEGNNYVNATKQIVKATDDMSAAEQRHILGLKQSIAASDAVVLARSRLAKANDLVQASADVPLTMREKAQQSQYKQAAGTRDRLTILSNVGADYDKEGFTKSIQNANAAAKNSESLSKFGQIVTTVQAAGVAGAKSIALFGGRLLNFIPILGALYSAYEIFDAIFSTNSKEAKLFRDSLEQLADITKTNIDVFTKFGNTLTVESLNAKATAFGDLSKAIETSTRNLESADQKASGFDKFIDLYILTPIGKNLKSGFTTTLADALSEGIKNIPDKGIRDEFEKKLKLETGAASVGFKDLKKALDDVPTKDIIAKGKALRDLADAANRPGQTSRALSQDIQAASKATAQAELDLKNSLSKTDAVGAYYEKVIDQLNRTVKGFADATTAGAEFQKIAAGTANINFLGTDGATQLTNIATEYTNFANSIKNTSDSLQQNKDKLAAIETQLQSKLLFTSSRNELGREADKIRGLISEQSSSLDKNKAQIVALAAQAKDIFQAAYTQAFDNAIASAGRKSQISSLNFQKSVIGSSPTQTPESLKQMFELDKRMLKLKELEITSQYDLIDALESTATNLKILDLEKMLQGQSRDAPFRAELQQRLKVEEAKLSLIGRTATPEQMETLRTSRDPSAIKVINSRNASNLARQETGQQVALLNIGLKQGQTNLAFEDKARELAEDKLTAERELEKLKLSTAYITASETDKLKQTFDIQERILSITKQQTDLSFGKTLLQTIDANATAGQVAKAEEQMKQAKISSEATRKVEEDKLKTAINLSQVKDRDLNLVRDEERQNKALFDSQIRALDVSKIDLEYKQAALQKSFEQGKITQDQFTSEKYLLDLTEAGLIKENALLENEQKYLATILGIRKKIIEASGLETPEDRAATANAVIDSNNAIDAIKRRYTATESLLKLNKSLSERQQAYTDLFKQGFKGMEDAIVNFTKTGKLEFRSMIDSFIEGLLRFEIQQQQTQLFNSIGGAGGLGKMLANFIGGTQSGAQPSGAIVGAPMTLGSTVGVPLPLLGSAKGNAFDYGIQAFAKGGTFTNSVVSSPTMFKFAQGTGLMGEAGPEAIMPLKRDASGNLGVRADSGGQQTNVVVNNYSGATAETKESVDSRGNRKIEITVGDMVAGEMTRPGSNTQSTLRNTYGIKPALVRR